MFPQLSVFKQEVHQSYFPFKPTPLTFKSYFEKVQGKEVLKKKKRKRRPKLNINILRLSQINKLFKVPGSCE